MTTFQLHLQSADKFEQVDTLVSFTAEDASGQFCIMAHHARMMTGLSYGLAKLRYENNQVEYLAIPGALLYFKNNCLYINTRIYLRSSDYQALITTMDKLFQEEETTLKNIKESLKRLDDEMLKRLWDLERHGRYEI